MDMDTECDRPSEVDTRFDDPAAARYGSLGLPSQNFGIGMFRRLALPTELTTLCPTDMDIDADWDQPNEIGALFDDPVAAHSGADEDTTHDNLEEFQGSGVEEYWDG
jgi:hypothetical protein